jgi:Asp-tRNA(Asn)/Glu-tRNA(Gln) amidotransferase A subunit family amidase
MPNNVDRRAFMAVCSALGLSSTLFPGVLWGMTQQPGPRLPAAPGTAPQEGPRTPPVFTKEQVKAAAEVAGLNFSDAQIEQMQQDIGDRLRSFKAVWEMNIPNDVAPALIFDPVFPDMKIDRVRRPSRWSRVASPETPKNIEDVCFYTVRQLGELLRNKRISSTALTEMYLDRLKRYDPTLHFLITPTTERAMAQAKDADREIAAGKYRGPVHGIPWGAKDLIAVKGYPTTWGAGGFEKQVIDQDATVVKRLDAAGAVLVAKLTLGALAQGDVWFGGITRNPWKTDSGSSGSSAGPGSATSAGCVGFAIGSETLGSISSPSTVNGVTGLRPTFGFVPRTGAMALSWSMDKLGPMCRAVEDCAVVLSVIHGPDGEDRTVHDAAFHYDAETPLSQIRIGYTKADFDAEPPAQQLARETAEQKARRLEQKKFNDEAINVLRTKLGIQLIDVELPKMNVAALRPLLVAEAAAAFDDLTRSGRDKLLTAQARGDWPNTFRAARLIPAVEYINENRARTVLMKQMEDVFKKVDVIVAPTFGNQLLITNLTGHPACILPNGFRESDGTPVSLTFLGNLYQDGVLCRVAKAYQDASGFHLKHPTLKAEPTPAFLPDRKLSEVRDPLREFLGQHGLVET